MAQNSFQPGSSQAQNSRASSYLMETADGFPQRASSASASRALLGAGTRRSETAHSADHRYSNATTRSVHSRGLPGGQRQQSGASATMRHRRTVQYSREEFDGGREVLEERGGDFAGARIRQEVAEAWHQREIRTPESSSSPSPASAQAHVCVLLITTPGSEIWQRRHSGDRSRQSATAREITDKAGNNYGRGVHLGFDAVKTE